MRTRINDAISAATRTNRELRFFPFSTGRPLFAALAIIAAAIGITILIFPRKLPDYEPYREKTIQLTGTVCNLESKLQDDTVVWRMILTDIKIQNTEEADAAAEQSDVAAEAGDELNSAQDKDAAIDGGADFSGKLNLHKREKILCVLDYEPEVEMGARVLVRGKVFPFHSAMNEGEFDLRTYYHILRIEYSLRNTYVLAASAPADRIGATLFHFKKYISTIIDRLFSTRNSAVLKAMLLGEKGLLEDETKELYQGAGIIHILSISGLHLSLLGMGLFSLLGKPGFIPLPLRAAVSIIVVFLYGKMIGMGTSPFRALIMLTIYIISKVLGRTYDILTAAAIAATLLLLDQPLYLLHTGFQFSFGAVLAIGFFLPALPGRALKAIAIPLATLPVYLYAYGTFPITSLILNLIVIPLMTVVMISSGAAVLLESLFDKLFGLLSAAQLSGSNTGLARLQLTTSYACPYKDPYKGIAGTKFAVPNMDLFRLQLAVPFKNLALKMFGRLSAEHPGRAVGMTRTIKTTASIIKGIPAGVAAEIAKTPAFFRWISRLAGLPAELILDFYRFLAETSEKIPGHEIVLGRPSMIQILLFYCMLFVFSAISVRLQMPHMRRRIEAASAAVSRDAADRRLDTERLENAGRQENVLRQENADRRENADGRDYAGYLKNAVSRKKTNYWENAKRLGDTDRRENAAHRTRRNAGFEESSADLLLRYVTEKTCELMHLKDNREREVFACVCSAIWLAAAVFVLTAHRPPAFEMDVLYVGQGDGILISSEGRHFMVDGGSSTKKDLAKYTLLPFLHCKGIGHLDGVIITHDDLDHCSGLLELLQAAADENPLISISVIYLPDISDEDKGDHYREIEDLAAQADIPICRISRGMRIRTGSLTLDCLHPSQGASYEDANEYSTTLLLRYADGDDPDSAAGTSPEASEALSDAVSFTALLTGDLEGQGEADLLQYLQKTKLLQNGHALSISDSPVKRDGKYEEEEDSKVTAEQDMFNATGEKDMFNDTGEKDMFNATGEKDMFNATGDKESPNVTLLKVAHHGSKGATSQEFLEMIHPNIALISAGIDNMYGHPSDELLERLRTASPQPAVFRTDLQGEITIWRKKRGRYQVKTFMGGRLETAEASEK